MAFMNSVKKRGGGEKRGGFLSESVRDFTAVGGGEDIVRSYGWEKRGREKKGRKGIIFTWHDSDFFQKEKGGKKGALNGLPQSSTRNVSEKEKKKGRERGEKRAGFFIIIPVLAIAGN